MATALDPNDILEVGEFREAAMWYRTAEDREKAKQYIQAAFEYDEQQNDVQFGPVEYYDGDVNGRRFPDPPEHGAKVLVGKARVWTI